MFTIKDIRTKTDNSRKNTSYTNIIFPISNLYCQIIRDKLDSNANRAYMIFTSPNTKSWNPSDKNQLSKRRQLFLIDNIFLKK